MADDLKVIVKAKELAVHSFKLTSNCNRYPKKYRHSLVDRIQIKSLDIYETLLEANRINNVSHKRERCETITKGNHALFGRKVLGTLQRLEEPYFPRKLLSARQGHGRENKSDIMRRRK